MSKEILISMLRQGNTGNDILSILDSIVSDSVNPESMSVDELAAELAEFEY